MPAPIEVEKAGQDVQNRFGEYILLRQVGVGGFGAVYKAWHAPSERYVALKLLHSEDPEDLRRFQREAKMAARLLHPNLVAIYEIGTHEEKHFIAMEFIEGNTLEKLRVESRRLLEIMRDASRAVQFAHENGIVHRDLKPQNLILGHDGCVRVMDFGLARQIQGGSTITMSGMIVGSPAYMPPEQALGERCDARSDVYSLGATLYELLTGRPPYEGNDMADLLEKMASTDPVPPRKCNPRIHPEVESIVLKAMEKKAVRRYTTAKDLADDLDRHVQGEPIAALPPSLVMRGVRWARWRRPVMAALVVTLISSVILGTIQIRNVSVHKDRRRSEIDDFLGKGKRAKERYQKIQVEAQRLQTEVKRLSSQIRPYAGVDEKRPLWALQKEWEDKQDESARCRADMIAAFTTVLGIEPNQREARQALAGVYFEDLERAERTNDPVLRLSETMVRLYDDGRYVPRLARQGRLSVASRPAGAEVYLFRYEPGDDRRLMPRPYNARRDEIRPPSVGAAAETAYFLDCSDFNRFGTCPIAEQDLAGGSYLLLLRKSGYRDVRYPVLVGRETRHQANVALSMDEEIGENFVYVPSGTFIMGGDPHAPRSAELRTDLSLGDFFIARNEVTSEEYLEFLNDRDHHNADGAHARAPRESSKTGYFWQRDGDGITAPSAWKGVPVMGISWEDAVDYCQWLTRRAAQRGEAYRYRLPTNVEWEKAARGVDGRFFPWGNHFEWTFTKGMESRVTSPTPEPGGRFLQDESPYGARDLAGSMREFCGDFTEDGRQTYKHARGGSWSELNPDHYRAAFRDWATHNSVTGSTGFRVVREPLPNR